MFDIALQNGSSEYNWSMVILGNGDVCDLSLNDDLLGDCSFIGTLFFLDLLLLHKLSLEIPNSPNTSPNFFELIPQLFVTFLWHRL